MTRAGASRDLLEIDFSSRGNSDGFVAAGWSSAEAAHRWTIGHTSELKLPPIQFVGDLALKLDLLPYTGGHLAPPPKLVISVNGHFIAAIALTSIRFEYLIHLSTRCLTASTENNLVFHLENRPQIPFDTRQDKRDLGLSFWTLRLQPWPGELFTEPEPLPRALRKEIAAHGLRALAMQFQSLGVNCEFGLVQRKMGAEPSSLLRFAFIDLEALRFGITNGFSGIDEPEDLEFAVHKDSKELMGRHRVYGLDYHTERYDGDVDVVLFKNKDLRRLRFLADRLIEDLRDAEKIFVIQRAFQPISFREIMGLLGAMRDHNKDASLLWVTRNDTGDPAITGHVERLGPGFYRGYIDRLAPIEDAYDLSFAPWLQICATVAAASGDLAGDNKRSQQSAPGLKTNSMADRTAGSETPPRRWDVGVAGRLEAPPVEHPDGALILLRAAFHSGAADRARASISVNDRIIGEIVLSHTPQTYGILVPGGAFSNVSVNGISLSQLSPIAPNEDSLSSLADGFVTLTHLSVESVGGQVIPWDEAL